MWPFQQATNEMPAEDSVETRNAAPSHEEGAVLPTENGSQESPKPSYVTTDQFNALVSQISELTGHLKPSAVPQDIEEEAYAEPDVPAPARSVTIEQINAAASEAYQNGDWSRYNQLFAKYNDESVQTAMHQFKQTEFAPVIRNGMHTMSEMSRQAAQQLPYYKKYEKEIKAAVRQMGPNAGANPASWKTAHDYVAGLHINDIVAEQMEQAARQTTAKHAAETPPTSGRGQDPKAPLSIKDAYGEEGYRELQKMGQMRGLSADQVVQQQYAKSRHKGDFQSYLRVQREAQHV